jgi:hypothetical protein
LEPAINKLLTPNRQQFFNNNRGQNMFKHKLTFTLLSIALSLQLLPAVSLADAGCTGGPKCQALGNKAAQIIQNLASQLGDIRDGFAVAYCQNKINAEVFRVCEDELRSSGNAACASTINQVEQAKQEAINAANQAAANAQSLTDGQWQQKCGWR